MKILHVKLFANEKLIGSAHTKMSRASSRTFSYNSKRLQDLQNRIISLDPIDKDLFIKDIKIMCDTPRNYTKIGKAGKDNLFYPEKLGLNVYAKDKMVSLDFSNQLSLCISVLCSIPLKNVQRRMTPSLSKLGKDIFDFSLQTWDISELLKVFPELLMLVSSEDENIFNVVMTRIYETMWEIMGYTFCATQNVIGEDYILFSYSFGELLISTFDLSNQYSGVLLFYNGGTAFIPYKVQPYKFLVT